MPPEILTPKSLSALWSRRSTLCGQILPDTPLVPRAVVVGQPLVTEPVQCKERNRGRDPAVAVGDDGLVSILGHTRLLQHPRELLVGVEGTALGIEEAVGVEVGGPWYTSRPSLSSRHGASILPLLARIENESVATLAGGEEAFGVRPPAAPRLRGEEGRLRFGDFGGGRPVLGRPLLPAAVEDEDTVVAVVRKGPPEAGGELATRVVVYHDAGLVADAERSHETRETFRGCDLRRHGVVGVGDVAGPVNVDCAWDVGLVVLLAGGEVRGLLAASAEVGLVYITPDIHDAHLLVIEMCGEPVGSDERVLFLHLLFLQDVVLAGVGFGEPARPYFVVLAETSFDHLVLQVVFENFDPTPRAQPELLHQIVAAQRALQLLDGVLGPYLLNSAPEAEPGFLGDVPPARRAPRDVGPGEPEEHVHVRKLSVAAREVGIPYKAPDRRVAPRVLARGVPVRTHVVGDEVGDGVYVVLGIVRPPQRSHPPSSALFHVLFAPQ